MRKQQAARIETCATVHFHLGACRTQESRRAVSEPWFILGAGALGTLFGGQLTLAGVANTLLHHRSTTHRRRLRVDGQLHERQVLPLAGLSRGHIRRLLITTKAGQVAPALSAAAPFLHKRAIVVIAANGLGFDTALPDALNGQQIIRAVSTAGAYRQVQRQGQGQQAVNRQGSPAEHDLVTAVAAGETLVGDGRAEAAGWFADSLAAVAGWRWCAQIERAVQRKFAINCAINGLSALHRCRNGELLDGGAARAPLRELCNELEPALRTLQLWREAQSLLSAVEDVCRQTAANRSSMLQDVDAARSTEIAFLNGEVLRRAAAHKLQLPLNRALLRDLARVEALNPLSAAIRR